MTGCTPRQSQLHYSKLLAILFLWGARLLCDHIGQRALSRTGGERAHHVDGRRWLLERVSGLPISRPTRLVLALLKGGRYSTWRRAFRKPGCFAYKLWLDDQWRGPWTSAV